jgi:chitinase
MQIQKPVTNLANLDERDRELVAKHKAAIARAYILAKQEIAGVETWSVEDDQAIDELRSRFMKMVVRAFSSLPEATMPEKVLRNIDLDKLEQSVLPKNEHA